MFANRKYNWLCAVLCWLLLAPQAMAAETTSPDELREGANAIIRNEETVFTVNSLTSGTTRFKTTITILNEYGDYKATLYVPYNTKMSKVTNISGTSYDRFGKKIKKLKNSDIKDVSAVSSMSVYEDSRVKIADLEYSVYPYTVEFEYELTQSYTMFYPRWFPQDADKLSVEKATLEVQVPLGSKLRYLEGNIAKKVAVSNNGTHEVYQWEVNNLKPLELEPFGPDYREVMPMVLTAPNEFEVDGYRGSMETWKDLGLWINKLNEGRDQLPEETVAKLKQLTANAKTTEEKVRLVYDYMQGKTRYVSIQLGIGSWQPFEASFVDSKGYGDCKALSNYTHAMLKAVGVTSHYALINGGEDAPDVKTEFPSSQFNHVILCVPMPQDTMWLECTSQTEAAGYNGSFTGDRHALLITPEGGKLVKTTSYGAADNQQIRSIKLRLDEKGAGLATVNTLYTGIQQETLDGLMHHRKPEEQRKWLYENVQAPPFEISKFSFTQKKDRVPSVTEELELQLRQCATLSGKRMFITPNLMSKWRYVPDQKAKRLTDVVRKLAYVDVDTVEIEVPVGYTVEYLPGKIKHQSVFGEYEADVKVDGQRITYVRRMQMHKGRFAPDTYAQLVAFYNNVVKADAEQVVLVKNIP
ncbi:DUF3857 domain-containing protein [Pontibacter mangrovi]|uniref:DUF3857 domain-containing protein n=1 Tax=Pontibacter mangrovi TaxID=2589816 RepID=A0A501WA89_9BACT|nr:DUF3857 domain-containing protein [Pontibacter mangrovi]TPE43727.1 DUF3857 domain-containing protein [Pontibacter mangrovi]